MSIIKTLNSDRILKMDFPEEFSKYKHNFTIKDVNKSKSETVSLNPAFVKALNLFIQNKIAYGYQKVLGKINYVLTEYKNEDGNVVTAYNPNNGYVYSCTCNNQDIKGPKALNESDGIEYWNSFIACILCYKEFEDIFDTIQKEELSKLQQILTDRIINKLEKPAVYEFQMLLNNNLDCYTLNASFSDVNLERANEISLEDLKNEIYIPTDTVSSMSFDSLTQSFECAAEQSNENSVGSLIGKYSICSITDESEKTLIPDCKEDWASESLVDVLQSIKLGRERVFIFRGDAGTGKSTMVQDIACALQMPYRLFNCSYDTDENSLISTIIPNMDSNEPKEANPIEFTDEERFYLDEFCNEVAQIKHEHYLDQLTKLYWDLKTAEEKANERRTELQLDNTLVSEQVKNEILFDPAGTVLKYTGYNYTDLTVDAATDMIREHLIKNDDDYKHWSCIADSLSTKIDKIESEKEKDKRSSDFEMVPSQIIEGITKPSVVEIMEPTLIGNPGVLPALNSLLDENNTTVLANGQQVKRDPNSIVIFTTNINYSGCKDINESVKSRATTILDFDELSEEDMVNRLFSRPITKELIRENGVSLLDAKEMARKMATARALLDNYVRENGLVGSVQGYREFSGWFKKWLHTKDAIKAAKQTIIPHITDDKELKAELVALIKTTIPS